MTIDNGKLTMKESLRDEIKKKFHMKTLGIILKSSRRDTTIVNCQFSIVNSLKIAFLSRTEKSRRTLRCGSLKPYQLMRTAATTRRPFSSVYSQVDRQMILSPYSGVMPVS